MPRTSRASKGGYVYHALNRGNGREDVFHKPDDFAAFVRLMREAHDHVPMRLTGYCLLHNHFHLRLWPHNDGDLSRWMQWLLTSHVRRYHRHYGGSGHVRQGRCGRAKPRLGMVKPETDSAQRAGRTPVGWPCGQRPRLDKLREWRRDKSRVGIVATQRCTGHAVWRN